MDIKTAQLAPRKATLPLTNEVNISARGVVLARSSSTSATSLHNSLGSALAAASTIGEKEQISLIESLRRQLSTTRTQLSESRLTDAAGRIFPRDTLWPLSELNKVQNPEDPLLARFLSSFYKAEKIFETISRMDFGTLIIEAANSAKTALNNTPLLALQAPYGVSYPNAHYLSDPRPLASMSRYRPPASFDRQPITIPWEKARKHRSHKLENPLIEVARRLSVLVTHLGQKIAGFLRSLGH